MAVAVAALVGTTTQPLRLLLAVPVARPTPTLRAVAVRSAPMVRPPLLDRLALPETAPGVALVVVAAALQ